MMTTATTTTTTSSSTPSSDSAPVLPDIAPTAKRLFLIRHGEVINPGGDRSVYYGAMDVPLSPLGQDEAKAAAIYLSRFDLQVVASSPLSRAIYGAQQVMDRQQQQQQQQQQKPDPVVDDMLILEGFRELQRGAWQGKTKDEITPELMARFDACDETVTPEGGESFPTLKERVLKARDAVLDCTSVGRASAIVSHLQVTRSILSDALGIPTSQMAALKVATASITCIDYDASTGTTTPTVHFQSYKPDAGLVTSRDGAN
jgi:broad specificity phosphatase PhoE